MTQYVHIHTLPDGRIVEIEDGLCHNCTHETYGFICNLCAFNLELGTRIVRITGNRIPTGRKVNNGGKMNRA